MASKAMLISQACYYVGLLMGKLPLIYLILCLCQFPQVCCQAECVKFLEESFEPFINLIFSFPLWWWPPLVLSNELVGELKKPVAVPGDQNYMYLTKKDDIQWKWDFFCWKKKKKNPKNAQFKRSVWHFCKYRTSGPFFPGVLSINWQGHMIPYCSQI